MNFLKQLLRVVFSAALGLWLMDYYEIEGFFTIILFLVIYIAVSLAIEAVWNYFTKKSMRRVVKKPLRKRM